MTVEDIMLYKNKHESTVLGSPGFFVTNAS